MFWGDDDLGDALVRQASTTALRARSNSFTAAVQASPKLHEKEALSAFGSTDAVCPTSAIPRLPSSSHTLEQHQAALPRLPIPSLEQTCQLYLKSIEGVATAEEYERNVQLAEDLQREGSTGQRLHRMLLEREATKSAPSWLEPWWDDMYLITRDAIPINVNYFFGLEPDPDAGKMTQLGRAVGLTHSAVSICLQLRNGTWSLDTERGKPLCMSQYRRVFCAARVPGEHRDHIVTYSRAPLLDDERLSGTSEYVERDPTHIVVMSRNRLFRVEAVDAATGAAKPQAELLAAFASIVATTESAKTGPPVGVLTTMERTAWHHGRQALIAAHHSNAASLEDVQSAIIVVALDGVDIQTRDEAARLYLHGTGTNRWFDRHNLIVTANGHAGINFEHSVGDGATTLRVADTMFRTACRTGPSRAEVDAAKAAAAQRGALPGGVAEITFIVDGTIDAAMRNAFTDFIALIESNETTTLNFGHFGGDYIKKSGISPDAFVQLAFQLTHYKLFGRLEATYESASTRAFLHGRTEVVRGVTRAALDFCESASQPTFSRRVNSKIPDQAQLLKQATEAHVDYMQRAKCGLGVDRHLLALRLLAVQHGIEPPALLHDPVMNRARHWTLSTSHCGSSALSLFGFGPVVSDGFGLGYMIKNDNISVTVTAKYSHRARASEIFAAMLDSCLLHMKAIVECDWERRRAQKPTALTFSHPTVNVDFEWEPTRGFVYRNAARPKVSLYQTSSPSRQRSDSSGS